MIKINNKDEESIANIVSILEKHSMQCRCGNLATPESIHGFTYKCLSCSKVYEGISYDFNRLTAIASKLASFDEALVIIRNNHKTLTPPSNALRKLWIKVRH